MGSSVWWVIIMRAFWFVVGAACVLLGLAVIVRQTTGQEAPAAGVTYQATVVSSGAIAATGGATPGCRLTVDPAGAPEESNAPTRLRSTRPCADLPAAGARVSLTWIDDGRTIVSDDALPAGDRPPLALGLVLLVLGAGGGVMFIRANRAFQRVLDDAGPPPVK